MSPTVSGTVTYEDKEYDTFGFTGNSSWKAVRYAAVEAVDSASGATLATATTDANGAYSLTLPSVATIYIRVISSASSPLSSSTALVSVKNLSNGLFAVAGPSFTASGAPIANISIATTSPAAGAFNILDVYTSAAQFVYSLSGSYPPALAAYWQEGNTDGTYYCLGGCLPGAGIYIVSSGGDTDEYDDDVLWHEYGHFIADKYSKDDNQGGVHYISSNDQDMRLSWSEGWGDFFPAAVKDWLTTNSPALLSTAQGMASSEYVDTANVGVSVSFDFGNPPAGSDYYYSSSEAAVAKVLHDLRTTYNTQAVWDAFTSTTIMQATPVTFESFWEGWNVLGKPDITSILNGRSISYAADIYENGDDVFNNSRLAVMTVPESHTLFGADDLDYIAFNATASQQYTVRTSSLLNGADTVIRVFTPDQILTVASNDNSNGVNYANSIPCTLDANWECHENGFDILGSLTSFTATATGIHYVEVKSSPQRPLSAGRYGSYLLTITSP